MADQIDPKLSAAVQGRELLLQDRLGAGLQALLCRCRGWHTTHDAVAVNRMMDLATRDLAVMSARVERIPGRMGFGDCVRATLPHRRAGEPGLLLLGHMDTVHPIGTLGALPWRQDGNRCYGPGI